MATRYNFLKRYVSFVKTNNRLRTKQKKKINKYAVFAANENILCAYHLEEHTTASRIWKLGTRWWMQPKGRRKLGVNKTLLVPQTRVRTVYGFTLLMFDYDIIMQYKNKA